MIRRIRSTIGYGLHVRPWITGHTRFLHRQLTNQHTEPPATSDEEHLRATAEWLAAAQDSQADGGISGRYKLHSGWSSSYPETTGYSIPTLLALADHWQEPIWKERAQKAITFLLQVQLPDGAFPGGEVAENLVNPSPFNTGQILNGLTSWFRATGDESVFASAGRAAQWLIGMQDDDGVYRRHFYMNQPSTYSTHLTCWLAEYGQVACDEPSLQTASRHLDWALQQQDKDSGWFDFAGFTEAQHEQRIAYTHTIAYTIWGVLFMGIALSRKDAIDAATFAAEGVMRRLELSKRLPGVLNHKWQAVEEPQCLTGNAQMALIWFKLSMVTGDPRFANAALKALDLVRRTQDLENPNRSLRGGVAGSDPVWGSYIPNALPNWAAKFFIDALLSKQEFLQAIATAGSPPTPGSDFRAVPS